MPGALDGAGAMSWMLGQLQAVRGQAATYVIKSGPFSEQSLSITLVPGSSLLVLGPANDQRIVRTDSDAIVRVSDMVAGGLPYRPQRGDQITTTLAGVSQTFEVRPPGPTEPPWRWEDQHEVIMRIHTHYLGAVQ